MMRSLWKFSVAIGMAALLVQSASAQRGGGRGFGGGLLENEGVQKELKLSDEQITKIKDITKEVREKHKDELEKVRALPREEQREKGMAIFKAIGDETKQALKSAKVMNHDQIKRYHQIELQVQGARAFQDPKVVEKLKLTDEQKEKIKTISEDADKERRELFTNAQGNRQDGFQKMSALHKATMEKTASVLTDDQKKVWKDMTGEPFEFKFTPRRRPAAGAAG